MEEITLPEHLIGCDPGECACLNMRRASRILTQLYDGALQPCGIRSTQFALLGLVWQRGPISLGELGEALGLDATTATRSTEILRRDGYLAVTVSTADARRKLLTLTPLGAEKIREALPLWAKAQEAFYKDLGPDSYDKLLEMLQQAQAVAHTHLQTGGTV